MHIYPYNKWKTQILVQISSQPNIYHHHRLNKKLEVRTTLINFMSICFQLNTTDKDHEFQYIYPIERPLLGGILRWNSNLHHIVSYYVMVLPLDTTF